MTEAEDRRRRWNYEPDTPMCCNCKNYRKARIVGKPPRAEAPFCSGGRFHVQANGCCDKWKSRNGETLK